MACVRYGMVLVALGGCLGVGVGVQSNPIQCKMSPRASAHRCLLFFFTQSADLPHLFFLAHRHTHTQPPLATRQPSFWAHQFPHISTERERAYRGVLGLGALGLGEKATYPTSSEVVKPRTQMRPT